MIDKKYVLDYFKNLPKDRFNKISKLIDIEIVKHPEFNNGGLRDKVCKYLTDKDWVYLRQDCLTRFVYAQNINNTYEKALLEVKSGCKKSHWIWFIFPQMKGLGTSLRSKYYGINGREEAIGYLDYELLRNRLVEITTAVYESKYTPYEIFGNDTIKFVSCMKLFASLNNTDPIFIKVLKKYKWN